MWFHIYWSSKHTLGLETCLWYPRVTGNLDFSLPFSNWLLFPPGGGLSSTDSILPLFPNTFNGKLLDDPCFITMKGHSLLFTLDYTMWKINLPYMYSLSTYFIDGRLLLILKGSPCIVRFYESFTPSFKWWWFSLYIV